MWWRRWMHGCTGAVDDQVLEVVGQSAEDGVLVQVGGIDGERHIAILGGRELCLARNCLRYLPLRHGNRLRHLHLVRADHALVFVTQYWGRVRICPPLSIDL